MSKLAEAAIKTFEYGQQVRVEGYQALGVVTVGNKHCVENGIDLVTVAVGSGEMHCPTGIVTATGVQMFYRKCRTTQGWSAQWVEISGRVVVNGERLYPRGLKIFGRNVTVMVHHEMANNMTEEDIKDDLCEFGH